MAQTSQHDIQVTECPVDCQEEVVSVCDSLVIPLENPLDSDIVSETVVVTTSPLEDKTVSCTRIVDPAVLGFDEAISDSVTESSDPAGVVYPDETQGCDSHVRVESVSVATTLQQLSRGGLWHSSGVLEDFTRLRDRLKKREQRKNPEYRRQETAKARVRMANRRSDPVLREIERKRDRERRALARQKTGVREKERERDKLYKKQQRDKEKSVNVTEVATIERVNNHSDVVIVDSSTSHVRNERKSAAIGNYLQEPCRVGNYCDIANNVNSLGTANTVNCDKNNSQTVALDCAESVTVYSESFNSGQVLTDTYKLSQPLSSADNQSVSSYDTIKKILCEDARTGNHGDTTDCTKIVVVYSENSSAGQLETDSDKASVSYRSTDNLSSSSNTINSDMCDDSRTSIHGDSCDDVRTSSHGDTEEHVKIICDKDGEVIFCFGCN